jgi:hypothetical protein
LIRTPDPETGHLLDYHDDPVKWLRLLPRHFRNPYAVPHWIVGPSHDAAG